MAVETFPVELGGRRWEIPRLPWRAVRQIQPRLMRQAQALTRSSGEGVLLRLDETALAEQGEILVLAVREVDPAFTAETLDALVFASDELAAAQIAVLRACGLRVSATAPSEAEAPPSAAP